MGVYKTLTTPGARVWMTAQTGGDAAELWDEARQDVLASPLSPLFKFRKARGSELMLAPHNGGQFRPHPPNEEKLHGKQSDVNIIDEAWVFDEAQAAALMQAIVPTQFSRPGAQLIIVSTMGTSKSTWFHGLVDRAQAGDPGIALLEWGIKPSDNPGDLETVAAAHPVLGHTMNTEILKDALSKMGGNITEFARAYGNRRIGSKDRLIPAEAWNRVQDSKNLIPESARVCFAAAVDIDRTEAVIAAAYFDKENETAYAEIVERRPGLTWVAKRLIHLSEMHANDGVIVDNYGPAATIYDELTRLKFKTVDLNARDVTTACQSFFDMVISTPPGIRIKPSSLLDAAVDIVVRRQIGDGWAWGRRQSVGSIAALEAVTLAVHAARHVKLPPPKPRVYF